MTAPSLVPGTEVQRERLRGDDADFITFDDVRAVASELRAARARECEVRREFDDFVARQALQTQELNHRLFNGLQSIASLLTAQSRTVGADTGADLTVAAGRILAFGQVHRRLSQLDRHDRIGLRSFLLQLCAELAGLFLADSGRRIVVDCINAELPSVTASPLGYIANELVTNAVKYGAGDITLRVWMPLPGMLTMSVSDQGSGLPAGFDPSASDGLGMKIVLSLASQLPGTVHLEPAANGRGGHLAVTFPEPDATATAASTETAAPAARPRPDADESASSAAIKCWIVRANIDQFTRQLETETDAGKREILTGLLRAEQAK